jgi:hypothetical protein
METQNRLQNIFSLLPGFITTDALRLVLWLSRLPVMVKELVSTIVASFWLSYTL